MSHTIFGVFADRDSAEGAVNKLKANGYDPKDISIVIKDREERRTVADDTGADVVEGAATGATSGAVLGGLAGLLASIALPGLGAFFIGGPIAAALGLTGAAATVASGATTGAVAGGILGALTGFGLSEEDAKIYEQRINEGGILVAVEPRDGDDTMVESVFNEYNAENIRTISA